MGSRGTLADVAAHAGVSVPTASKVVNGRADVAPATRARVMAAVEAVGYLSLVRRAAARASTGVLELLIEGVDSPWSMAIVQGIEAEAARRGAALMVTSSVGERFAFERWVDGLRTRRPDGVVAVLPSQSLALLERVRRLERPVVLVDSEDGGDRSVALVRATDWAGGHDAAAHLIGLGHRRIGCIAGPADLRNARIRREGWAAALRGAGLDAGEDLVVHAPFESAAGHEAGARLLDAADPPTGVVCGSDAQAAGLYEAARERGLRVPDDVSVVGFDDTIVARSVSPALTTMHQPLTAMGAEAVRIALTLATEPGSPLARRIELPVHLVVRRSTGPAPTGRGRGPRRVSAGTTRR